MLEPLVKSMQMLYGQDKTRPDLNVGLSWKLYEDRPDRQTDGWITLRTGASDHGTVSTALIVWSRVDAWDGMYGLVYWAVDETAYDL